MTKGSLIFETEGIAMMFYDGVDWVYAYRPYTPQLYEFTSYTFKPIVNRGSSEGPSFSSMQATYAGQPFMTEGYFSQGNNLGYQLWTVPMTELIELLLVVLEVEILIMVLPIFGGASMRGDFDLLAGDTIEMCIGSGGNQYGSPHGNEAGGGGGTFVRNNTTGSVMIVAGGGGGSAGNVYGNSCTRNITNAYGQTSDTAAQTTCQGNYTVNSSTSGQGGTGAGQYWGGGGGGYVGDGAFWIYSARKLPVGGKSFGNGAVGGNGNHCYTPSGQGNRGGFGGGGGGNLSGPGGGGGYTGGNSSGYWSSYSQHGGGAGSFNNGQNQINTRGGNSSSAGGYSGAGYVTIQFL